MAVGDPDSSQRGWTPVPDPTALTTDQLRREISAVREILHSQLDVFRQRFSDMDKSVETAFSASKEQAYERQASINKSLDQMNKIMEATTGKVDGKVDDLRERMTAMESWSKGVAEQKKNAGLDLSLIFAGVTAIWAIIATITAIVEFGRH